jgi:sn-glycerol 3-phosphate transport system ATP-binding protein
LVHAKAGGQALVLRAPASSAIAAGQCVTAGFDAESVHWFDAHTTQRLGS